MKLKSFIKICLLCLIPAFSNAQFDPNWGFVNRQQADSLKRSLSIEKNDTLLMAANRSLGFYYQETKLDSGLYFHQQQLKLAKKLAIKMWLADAYSQVGFLLFFMGNTTEGYDNFMEAKKIADDEKNETSNWHPWVFSNSQSLHDARLSILAMNYNGLGSLYYNMGEPEKGMDAYKEAIRLGEQTRNGKILATVYGNMAGRLSPDSMIQYSKKAIQYEDESGYKKNTGGSLLRIAGGFYNKKNVDSTLHYVYASMQANLEQNNMRSLQFSYNSMIGVYIFKNKLDSSLIYAKKILSTAESLQTPSAFLYAYNSLANVYGLKKNNDSALKYKQLAYKLNDSLQDVSIKQLTGFQKSAFNEQLRLKKLDEEKRELAQQKELELKALNFEYEKKQAAAKNEKEKQQLKYEQQLKQQQIEASYASKTAQVEAEQKRKEAVAKLEQEKRDAQNASALALSQAEVKRQSQQRNFFLAAFALVAVLLGFIGYSYTQKRKANQLLQAQKAEIDQKSLQLEKSLTELQSTQAQLIQSEKLASLGELTAGIAHEIQNPLNFVNNFSEVNEELLAEMKDELDKGNIDDAKAIANDAIENQQKILHHGKRADAIVKGMLQHSRSSTGVKEPTNINALADEYLRLAYHGLRAKDKSFNATMKTDYDESIGNINIIPQDIGRVILNLITNAFYAAPLPPEGGFLDPEYKHSPTVWVSTKKMGDKVLISVRDNGPGIPQKILDKIFQPFFTTKPTGQGTGLGLSLSYDIVKAHGGELKVETKEARPPARAGTDGDDPVGRGEGSEFIILLPVV